MSVTIKPVNSRCYRKKFIKLPWKIYREDPNWVPPLIIDRMAFLNPKKNPYFEHSQVQLFLAYKNGKLAGRISAHENRNHNAKYHDTTGFWGFFECINDQEVANALFDAAVTWLRLRDLSSALGPANFSVNEEFGLLVDGFDTPPCIMMLHNPPYYQTLLENYGFKKAHDLYAYELYDKSGLPDTVVQRAIALKESGEYTIRNVRLKELEKEVSGLHHVLTEAWQENWSSVPMTEEEILHLAKDMKPVLDEEFFLIAEKDGKAVGFSVFIPDMNEAIRHANGRLFPFGLLKILWYKRKIRSGRVPLMGVLKEHRHKGIDSAFYYETYVRGRVRGYQRGEASWILETNAPMNKALQKLGAKIYKIYRMYEYKIK